MDKSTALFGLDLAARPDLFTEAKQINKTFINTPDYWFRVRITFTDLGGDYTKEYINHFQGNANIIYERTRGEVDISMDFNKQPYPVAIAYYSDATVYFKSLELLSLMFNKGGDILDMLHGAVDGDGVSRIIEFIREVRHSSEELTKNWVSIYDKTYNDAQITQNAQTNQSGTETTVKDVSEINEVLQRQFGGLFKQMEKVKAVEVVANDVKNRGIETFRLGKMLGFAEYCVKKGVQKPLESHLGWYYGHSLFKGWKPENQYLDTGEEFKLDDLLKFAEWCCIKGIHEPTPGNLRFWFGYIQGVEQAVSEKLSNGKEEIKD